MGEGVGDEGVALAVELGITGGWVSTIVCEEQPLTSNKLTSNVHKRQPLLEGLIGIIGCQFLGICMPGCVL